MTIDMTQFYQVFFEESEEHLAAMESLLLALDIEQPDPEDLNAIFRAAHSIKGSSGTFGFTNLTEVTHILETLLDRLRKNEISLRSDMVDAFLEAGDVLKTMLAGHRGEEGADPQVVAAVCARLNQLAGKDQPAPVAASAPTPVSAAATAPATSAPAVEKSPLRSARPCYDIEFVPTAHAAADASIIPGLLDELSGYGELQVISRPDETRDGASYWHLRLTTDQSAERLGESIDFIAEQDAWRIKAIGSGALNDAGGAFGLFEDAAGLPVVDESFGLFEDAPGASRPDLIAMADEGEGYGLFDMSQVPDPVMPVAAASGSTPADGDGYGFFTPVASNELAAELAVQKTAPVSMLEEGDGFGFFAPLPPVATVEVLAPPVVASLPVALAEAPKPAVTEVSATPRAAAKPSAAVAAENSSIRVGVEKVDQLINLVGELVITQAMLLQCADQMGATAPERLIHGLAQLERNSRDLQETVMSIRMLPISFVFSRFPRVVRDLSSKLGKQVELKMFGENTELDKGLIEKIADPLTHLIRNSLDHGIEQPDVRTAAGKNPTGTITLRAAHQGGNIVIEVGDDGGGLSRAKILAKARERGFQISDQMTDAEVWMLIFEAGFSTADVVTDVSGRGVGMDVVRRNIQAMGGRVEIESITGAGTRMTVRLPLTLAILDGMSVAVGQQTYILPLSYVIESVQPDMKDVKTLSNQARVIRVRGEYLPVIVLHEIFGIQSAATNFTQGIMIVLDADGTKAALFVDALVGQHQVVIKSLENNYRRVAGVSGATIMGDGHVALILDVSALAAMAKSAQMAAA
jgi:two-component system chemotaxis sensor kinase CheA